MITEKVFDITLIGGGIVSLASAYTIQKNRPDLRLLVVEKEQQLASHQSGHNSGVIHSGIYYKPGSYKAKNCVAGRKQMVAFAKEYHISHDICGKIIVAANEKELPVLNTIFENGKANGVEDIRIITPDEIKEIEPFVEGLAGIFVGCAGIIDYQAVVEKMGQLIPQINAKSEIRAGYQVQDFSTVNNLNIIHTDKGSFQTKKMVFCAGLYSDRLARKQGIGLKERIVGFRGDYYEMTEKGKQKINHLVYPVPNPEFPFLGVHFTRMTDGSIECGPNAVFTFKREGYGKTDFNFNDTLDALTYKGTWKLFKRHWRFGLDEYHRAFSKEQFLKTLQKMVPSLTADDIQPGRAGVRAMLLNQQGDTRDDFRIEFGHDSIHVLNAPSPAATASLAIGDEIWQTAQKRFSL